MKTSVKNTLERSKGIITNADAKKIANEITQQKGLNLSHLSGFDHPKMVIYPQNKPNIPLVAFWGLVPTWIKTVREKEQIWSKTLNARIETLTEKPAFKGAFNTNKCIIFVNGFYEHHHMSKKNYPYFIKLKNGKPLIFAGLSSNWINPLNQKAITTFTIVTTKANTLLAEIHNNPKLKHARMPLMLSQLQAEEWLHCHNHESFMHKGYSFPSAELEAHTTKRYKTELNIDYSQKESYLALNLPKQGSLF